MHAEIVQVVPNPDYTVTVFFADGKIVSYDTSHLLKLEVFKPLQEMDFFINHCTILNNTLSWDVSGNRDNKTSLDIDPLMLYSLPDISAKTA